MGERLWSAQFTRISIAGFLLFVSLYALFPALAVEMADLLGVSVGQTGVVLLCFILGTLLIGPFHAYLVDAYKRKYVCISAVAVMLATTAGYARVHTLSQLALLVTLQGIAFGIGTTAGITLAIDVTGSTLRSAANFSFSRVSRFGMIVGVALGVWLYQIHSFENLLAVSIAVGATGMLLLWGVYLPFRAPIVTKVCSCDRFLLVRGWVLAVNLLLVTFVPGLLISLAHPFLNDSVWGEMRIPVPFFLGTAVGYLLSLLLVRLSFFREHTLRVVCIGSGLEIISLFLPGTSAPMLLASVCLGVGLGLLLPEFLRMFVHFSQHCQRGTANTTHLLASETGIISGIAVSCLLEVDTERMLHIGQSVSVLALLFFCLITYPYYIKKKVR